MKIKEKGPKSKLEIRKSENTGYTPGVLYTCEKKGFARKGFCKIVKTKEKKIDESNKTEQGAGSR